MAEKSESNFSAAESSDIQNGLLKQFKYFVETNRLFQANDRLLVAVSGGVDSVVLCDLCHIAGYQFAVAHVNFQLRGEESGADELFVKSLSEIYHVPFYTTTFDTELYAKEQKLNIQAAARELRYKWFAEQIDAETGAAFSRLLTAHHSNDNVETVLHNFFKGSGISGLTGINPSSRASQRIVRPLLFAKKDQLIRYAAENNLPYREDSSNKSPKYTRNFLRNEILPTLKSKYPMIEDNILDNIMRFRDVKLLYKHAIAILYKETAVVKGNEIFFPVLKLRKAPALSTVAYEFFKSYGFKPAQVPEILTLMDSSSGKFVQSSSHRILRNRNWLILSPRLNESNSIVLIERVGITIQFGGKKLQAEEIQAPSRIITDAAIALLDANLITFPLLIRKWKTGDYFYPLGMKKKKKLSRFFIDQKLSLTAKENVVVVEMDKKIIWVAGLRIDDRFKITPASQSVIKLSISPAE